MILTLTLKEMRGLGRNVGGAVLKLKIFKLAIASCVKDIFGCETLCIAQCPIDLTDKSSHRLCLITVSIILLKSNILRKFPGISNSI